nr:pentatricopeptide repeat-containing protein, mitochondrial [Quercus suber]
MDKRGCAQDTDTYCLMIDGLFGCNKIEDACFLLEDMINKGMKLPYRKFDSFLMQLSVIGDLRAIHRLSEHMKKFYNPAMARRIALNEKRKSISLRGKWRRGLMASNIVFTHSPFWVQVWGLPFEMMDKEVGKELRNSLGKFIESDKRIGQAEQAKFMRIRVDLPLEKPLRFGGKITNTEGGKFWVTFKYERLPIFFFLCGKMGHGDKHCPENSDWHNASRQYCDWLKANGKVGFEKSRSTSNGGRDDVSGDRDEENAQTMVRNPYASVIVDGEGSFGNGEKQAQSDKGSMMGWEITCFPRCQSVQKPDGWNNSIQIQMENTSGQTTTARASLDNSPNGSIDNIDKNKGPDYASSFVGQHA